MTVSIPKTKKKMKEIILPIVAMTCVLFGFFPTANAAEGWTNFGAIAEINQQGATTPGNEMLFITVSVTSNPSDPATCTVRDGFYLAVTTELQKRLFAMLLMAKATGQNVRLYVTANCHLWGYAEIQGMIIQ